MSIINLAQDILFVMTLLVVCAVIIWFFSKAVRAGYRRAMIEHMQNMTEDPRKYDSTEESSLEDIRYGNRVDTPAHTTDNDDGINVSHRNDRHIQMYRVHMLAPNTAQYGRRYATYVPSADGIPLSAFPNIDMRNPWSLSEVEAAEVPEKTGCRKTATGRFYDCSVPAANSCE